MANTAETENAVRIAGIVLDRDFTHDDPDSDLCVLARQFLRAREANTRLARELTEAKKRLEELGDF